MNIINRIKLADKNYYINCNCEYQTEDKIVSLRLKNYKDNYYDGGDLAKLIKKIENNYNESTYKKYGSDNWFLSDCLYIYDNIPIIESISDVYFSLKNGSINSLAHITKTELDKYIKDNNIKMKDQTNFKLYDERTW